MKNLPLLFLILGIGLLIKGLLVVQEKELKGGIMIALGGILVLGLIVHSYRENSTTTSSKSN